MTTNRRDFLVTSGFAFSTAALGLALPQSVRPAPKSGADLGPVGVQLYSVRKSMQSDFEGTLQKVAAIGYRQVEFAGLFGHSSSEVRGMLDRLGLTAPSMHVPFESLDAGWDAVLEDAHRLGCRYVIVPSIPAAHPARVA